MLSKVVNNSIFSKEIKETIAEVNINLKTKSLTSEIIQDLLDEFKELSYRDSFEIRLIIDGNVKSIESIDEIQILNEHITDFSDDEVEYIVEIDINKKILEHTISIYFFDKFLMGLSTKKLEDVLTSLWEKFDERLLFEVYSDINTIQTKTIGFFAKGKSCEVKPLLYRGSRNNLLTENRTSTNLRSDFLADDFFIIKGQNSEVIELFNKICAFFALQAVSNNFEFDNVKNIVTLKINGYKTIKNELDINLIGEKHKLIYKIYNWAYEGGNVSDKIGLIRNVLSLHLDEKNLIVFDDEVWNTIQSNYQIYLKENIQSYLEIKNKIGEFVLELSSKTYSMSDEVLNSFKSNVAILLTYIISVIIVNGIKDNGIENIFSIEYISVSFFISIVSFIWFCLLKREIIKRFDKATSNVKSILIRNYKQIIMSTEIDNTLKPVILKNKKYLKTQIVEFKKYLILFILIVNVFLISGNFLFTKKKTAEAEVYYGNKTIQNLIEKERINVKKLNEINKEIALKLSSELIKLKLENEKLMNNSEVFRDKLEKLKKENKKLKTSYMLLKKSEKNK